MRKRISLSFEIEDGEDVLLVAMCSTGITLSIAKPMPKDTFGEIVSKIGPGTRPVNVFSEPLPDAPAAAEGDGGVNEFGDLAEG